MKFQTNRIVHKAGMPIDDLIEMPVECRKTWPDCYVATEEPDLYLYELGGAGNSLEGKRLYQIIID